MGSIGGVVAWLLKGLLHSVSKMTLQGDVAGVLQGVF